MSFAVVFPGQGSQSVGMLKALAQTEPAVRATFEEASAVLGYDLWALTQDGPREQLDATECTQPALLTAGVAIWRVWRDSGGALPQSVSGHSLGEFTALVCAEALTLAQGVDLVRFRGQVMQDAVPRGAGAMAAILGLEDAEVEAACRESSAGEVVEAVNFNSPGQVVIAGAAAAVGRAIEAAKARGAKRAMPLAVSVPSHSSLMRGAGEKLGARLRDLDLRAPVIPYLSPVDVAFHERPEDIRAHLRQQLSSPVRWTATVRALASSGIECIVECGPGKVLTGLNRRIEKRPGLEYWCIEDAESLRAALAATGRVESGVRHVG